MSSELFEWGVLGVLASAALIFPILFFMRRSSDEERAKIRHRRVKVMGSIPVMLFGAGWLVERAFGLEFMPL